MRNRKLMWVGAALAVALSGCSQDAESEGVAYVLVDLAAREAGVSVLVDGVSRELVLPERIDIDASLELLVPGEDPVPLELTPESFAYVWNQRGEVLLMSPEEGLALDEVWADGDDEAIQILTEALGAERMSETGEPLVRLRALDILRSLAEETAPEGLREIRPIVQLQAGATGQALPSHGAHFGPGTTPAPLLTEAMRVGAIEPDRTLIDLSPMGCDDRATGTWVSRQYYPTHGGTYEFTLEVQKQGEGGELTGQVLSHFWRGTDDAAPACSPTGEEWIVTMPAKGQLEGGRIAFGGTAWSVKEARCGMPPMPGSYSLDQFTADAHINKDTLGAVNNDGGVLINHHTAFKRISCTTTR